MIFSITDKTAKELFEEAKHIIVGIENLNASEVGRYIWNGESPNDEPASDNIGDNTILFSPNLKRECLDSAIGLLTDIFSFLS